MLRENLRKVPLFCYIHSVVLMKLKLDQLMNWIELGKKICVLSSKSEHTLKIKQIIRNETYKYYEIAFCLLSSICDFILFS